MLATGPGAREGAPVAPRASAIEQQGEDETMASQTSTTDQAAYDALMIALGDGAYGGRPVGDIATYRQPDGVRVVLSFSDDALPPTTVLPFDYGVNTGPK